MVDLFSLAGKCALVTGASGGLGRDFALALARAGADLAVAARRPEPLAETARAIEGEGRRAFAIPLDVTDAARVDRAITRIEAEFAPLDIVVNNAGVARVGPFVELAEADWDAVIDTNLKGCFLIARAAARAMSGRGAGGSIVNIASTGAIQATRDLSAYCASKAALVHLTESLALEWAGANVRVNALAFTYVETDMTRDFVTSEAGERARRKNPMGRFALPADLEGPLLLLASGAGRYMTGSVITIDGGKTLA